MIKVIRKSPHKNPEMVEIDNTLESLQKEVGGHIECYPLSVNVEVICNEEGLFTDALFNCSLEGAQFFGTILLVGVDREEFADCPLSIEDIKKFYPHLFINNLKGVFSHETV